VPYFSRSKTTWIQWAIYYAPSDDDSLWKMHESGQVSSWSICTLPWISRWPWMTEYTPFVNWILCFSYNIWHRKILPWFLEDGTEYWPANWMRNWELCARFLCSLISLYVQKQLTIYADRTHTPPRSRCILSKREFESRPLHFGLQSRQ